MAEDLRRYYIEFIEHYESLDIFANLRIGRMNSEQVPAMNLPDVFAVSPRQIETWAPLYERALANSTNEIVVSEGRLFVRTHAGQTRRFVRDMNKLTEKFFGRRFTDSEMGREFHAYQKHIAVLAIQRMGLALGVTIPVGAATGTAERVIRFLAEMVGLDGTDAFLEEEGTQPSPEPAPAP